MEEFYFISDGKFKYDNRREGKLFVYRYRQMGRFGGGVCLFLIVFIFYVKQEVKSKYRIKYQRVEIERVVNRNLI